MKKNWKTHLKELAELWFDPQNRKLTLVWTACLIGILLMTVYTAHRTSSFLGIADSRESIINFEFPVTIKKVHYLPGQAVRKGDLLIELDQPDLELKMHLVRSQIEKLKAERSLKQEMGRLASSVSYAKSSGDDSFDPIAADIKNLQKELEVLEHRERNLYVFAEISGVVGSVNFKRGERVSPYSTILTISPSAPTHVQGFIHENLSSQVAVGQRMQISSLSDPSKKVEGRVVSVGSRIVELPLRMGRTTTPMWGREVALEIVSPVQNNSFLLGEKVAIQPPFAFVKVAFAQAQAEEESSKTPALGSIEPMLISVPDNVKSLSKFEPSGAVYMPDLHRFILVSDDTDEKDTPMLYMLNADGSLEADTLRIDGLPKISDLESISAVGHKDLYLMASQSVTDLGKEEPGRNLLVHVRRDGAMLKAVKTVKLRPALLKALKESPNRPLAEVSADIAKHLEIEASLVREGRLLVGLKYPLDNQRRSLILDLGPIDAIMKTGKVDPAQVSLFKALKFWPTGPKGTRITDLIALDDQRFVIATTTKDKGKIGRVWIFDPAAGEPALLQEFPEYTPEGLAIDGRDGDLLVVFDEGKDDARYVKLKLPGRK